VHRIDVCSSIKNTQSRELWLELRLCVCPIPVYLCIQTSSVVFDLLRISKQLPPTQTAGHAVYTRNKIRNGSERTVHVCIRRQILQTQEYIAPAQEVQMSL
jgi:hypothetical protein